MSTHCALKGHCKAKTFIAIENPRDNIRSVRPPVAGPRVEVVSGLEFEKSSHEEESNKITSANANKELPD